MVGDTHTKVEKLALLYDVKSLSACRGTSLLAILLKGSASRPILSICIDTVYISDLVLGILKYTSYIITRFWNDLKQP